MLPLRPFYILYSALLRLPPLRSHMLRRMLGLTMHKVHTVYIRYLEYHSVCPFVRTGTPPPPPPPLPLASVSSPWNQRRWEHTRLRVRGWGGPNSDDWRKILAFCLLVKAVTTGMHLGVRHGGNFFYFGPLFIVESLCYVD